ncbi:MAG: phospholipase [Bacteroidales bacterium 45-6]|nr:MAG: phospholipase [Bacteroidales bacterium 45-6]
MRYIFGLLLLSILFATTLSAQKCEAVRGKTTYSFWLHTPENNRESALQPIFVFLHGRSLCGNNLDKVKRYGVLYAMGRGQDVPGFVVAPQTQGAWNASKVMEVVDYVLKNYPQADESRIYICGMSLGGYGTMEVAGKFPDRVAAAVAICGGGTLSEASSLGQVPIWLIHGTADRSVPISESKKIYNAIRKSNPNAEIMFDEVKGGTHGSVEKFFHKSDIYHWMLEHRKAKS